MSESKIEIPIEIFVGGKRYIDRFGMNIIIETGGEVMDGKAIVHIEGHVIEGDFIDVAEAQDIPTLLRYVADVMDRGKTEDASSFDKK